MSKAAKRIHLLVFACSKWLSAHTYLPPPPWHSECGQRSWSTRHAVRLCSRPSPRPYRSAADALPRKDSGRAFPSCSSQLTSVAFLLSVDEWLSVVSTSRVGMLELGSLFSSFPTKRLASPIPPPQVTVAGAQLQDFTLSAFQHTMTVKSASSLHMQSEEAIHTSFITSHSPGTSCCFAYTAALNQPNNFSRPDLLGSSRGLTGKDKCQYRACD